MRVLLAATMAASALAIGLGTEPAASLPLGGQAIDAGAPIHRVQQKDKEMSPLPGMERPRARGPDDGGRMRRGDRGMRDDGPRTGQRSRDWNGDRARRRYDRPGFGFSFGCRLGRCLGLDQRHAADGDDAVAAGKLCAGAVDAFGGLGWAGRLRCPF